MDFHQLGELLNPITDFDMEDAWKKLRGSQWPTCACGKPSRLRVRWYGANSGRKFFGCGSTEPNQDCCLMEDYVDYPYKVKSMEHFRRLTIQVDYWKEENRVLKETISQLEQRISYLQLLLRGATHLLERLLSRLENRDELSMPPGPENLNLSLSL